MKIKEPDGRYNLRLKITTATDEPRSSLADDARVLEPSFSSHVGGVFPLDAILFMVKCRRVEMLKVDSKGTVDFIEVANRGPDQSKQC